MFLSLKQSLSSSLKSLTSNKTRSFLTMLGIIIGVSAVIIIIAVGAGAQSLILGQIEGVGTNLISITPGRSDDHTPPTSIMGVTISSLDDKDLKSLEDNKDVLGLSYVSAGVSSSALASWSSNSYSSTIEGVSSSYFDMNDFDLSEGRFFTKEENDNLNRVVVLGYSIKDELFGEEEALGERIRMNNNTYEVIGVLEERGQVFFQNIDDVIFMPVKTLQKTILAINYFNSISVKTLDSVDADDLVGEIELMLRDNHGILDQSGDVDDFTIRTASEIISMVKTITNALKYFLALMASLSLVVGGVGIMNIMLISVNERTREIGLRKALGASRRAISNQFLMESIFLTVMGGLIGVAMGFLFSFIIYLVITYLGYDWVFKVSPFSIFLGVSVSALVGLVFGLYPAKRASKLEPVEALSYE